MSLIPKREKFCQEYLIDLNGTQAAIRAGYSKNTANEQAARLLANVSIQSRTVELKKEREKRTQVTADEVIKDIIELKNRCMQKVPVLHYDKELKQYVQEEDKDGNNVWKFDSQGANKALDMLAKHTGAYERDNLQQAVTINFQSNYE